MENEKYPAYEKVAETENYNVFKLKDVAPKKREGRAVPRVSVYARHTSECKYGKREGKSADAKKLACGCPKQLCWFADGSLHRQAAGTDRDAAEKMARAKTEYFEALAKGETPMPPVSEQSAAQSLEGAIETFLTTTRKTRKTTEKRHRMIKNDLKLFCDFCAGRGLFKLAEIKTLHCLDFSNSLVGHQNTRAKKVQNVSRFFAFCVDLEMLLRNPVTAPCRVKKTSGSEKAKALTAAQFEQLLAAVDKVNGATTPEQRRKLRSLVLLMRYSGLAIKDATCLERGKLTDKKTGFWSIELNRAKTGKPVIGSMAADIVADILAGANPSGRYLFTDLPLATFDEQAMDNYVATWNGLFGKLSKVAEIKDEHDEPLHVTSHWCRHSFVLFCITAGLATSDIAQLIGDTEKTVSDYYSTWLDARQQNLTGRMEAALTAAAEREQALTASAGR